jgi:DNA replication protein DnaC
VLTNPTVEGLRALRCEAMAAALIEQAASSAYQGLSFEERLGLLVDKELAERDNRRQARLLKSARLRSDSVIEDLELSSARGLERATVLELAGCAWVRAHHMVAIVGATGVGKTYLACALANAAIRQGHSALYLRGPRMLEELSVARVDGRFARLMSAWARIEVLVVDDFLLRPLSVDQAADVLEVIEDRAGLRSTIVTSQLPIANWHEAITEPTIADSLMDRLCWHLRRIELHGESMRRRKDARGDIAVEEAPSERTAPKTTTRAPRPQARA